ncbi:hypothetical protein [Algoriphagus sp.]|uniref:hypothetical protein n=1 Tax=Algoriphagus sp. TaxID=1872435 RepID=UPI0025DBE628|nr:hypothetical protein [Algoriphagus sp.]
MSYLNSPRLTFSGQFQADPSTVNNDPTHFNNESFQPNFQKWGAGASNGWWNPEGTGSWRFLSCGVKSVTYLDGTSTSNPQEDPIIGMTIMDSNTKVAGKIVDLDSQQQMVSALWGLVVRLVSGEKEVIKSDYEVASFTNIWMGRAPKLGGDTRAAAIFQSVLKNISWDIDSCNSRYLNELFSVSKDQLSIQFTTDLYEMDNTSPKFTIGRIVGSIGPHFEEEPTFFTIGRPLFPMDLSSMNYANAILDKTLNQITLDLANSFQINPNGTLIDRSNLILAVNKGQNDTFDLVTIGEIILDKSDWYSVDAGINSVPLADKMDLVEQYPLVILDGNGQPIFQESEEYVCADKFVFYLNPEESCQVDLYASKLGKPLAGKEISFLLFDTPFGPTPPKVSVPKSAINLPSTALTDSYGKAIIKIKASDPGNPRGYIDGQVYGVAYNFSDGYFSDCNQSNFISLLVFDSVDPKKVANPTWEDIQPIMQQYANLYPLMSKGIFNLADKSVVDNNAEILKFVFSKEKEDPNYMPATRDLSKDKSAMIINYLNSVLNQADVKDSITFKKL